MAFLIVTSRFKVMRDELTASDDPIAFAPSSPIGLLMGGCTIKIAITGTTSGTGITAEVQKCER